MTEEAHRGHLIHTERHSQYLARQKKNTRRVPLRFNPGEVDATSDDPEVLHINGKQVPYVKTWEGFHIYYHPPAASLMEAARSYVDSQREVAQ